MDLSILDLWAYFLGSLLEIFRYLFTLLDICELPHRLEIDLLFSLPNLG